MSKSPEPRYCARGEKCTQYARLGEPSKLHARNEGGVCEACRRASLSDETPVGPSQTAEEERASREEDGRGRPDGPEALPSSAKRRVQQLRRELTLQLYLRRGPLWEAVCDVRDRWDIVAKVQLPPSVEGLLLPEGAPVFESRGEFTEYVRWSKYVGRWTEEMSAVRDKVIQMPPLSTRAFFDPQSETSWNNFLSACVLYDPPDDGLIEFASYADLEPIVLSPKPYPGGADLEGLPRMVDPPIRSLWDLTELRDWYWQRVLKRVGEKYLEPQGIDVDALLENIMVEAPGLREEHVERYKRYSRRYYLEVDEHTTVDDVKNALRMIRAMGDARPTAAKPPRDRLTAVQCAVLRREYGSTYRELAQRFRLGSTDSAEEYVKLGKEILQED